MNSEEISVNSEPSTSTSSPKNLSPSLTDHTTVDILEITTADFIDDDMHSTSAILNYCSNAILKPYHRLLTMLGWRPISTLSEDHYCLKIVSSVYLVFVVIFTFLGYVLQYASCFRRDKASGFFQTNSVKLTGSFWDENILKNRTCNGSVLGLYIFPNFLHLSAFAYTLYLFRICQYEQLHTLVEKAFLQTFHLPTYFSTQPKLVRSLRIFLFISILWLLISFATQILHVNSDWPTFTWLETGNFSRIALLGIMMTSLFWQDLIHVTILWCYGIQCQLLMTLLRNLSDRIRGKIDLQDAIKEINEYCKFIKYLNEEMSIPIAILILYSGSLMSSGLTALLMQEVSTDKKELYLTATILSVIIWGTAFIFPVIQAARLTGVCQSVRLLGHHMRSRPFGYQNTTQEDLDSFLLFTSTINMKTTLFCVPVYSGMVISSLAICIFVTVLLGELNIINLGF